MDNEFDSFKDNKIKFKDKFSEIIKNMKRFDVSTLIFTKNKFLELKKSIEEIQVRTIKDYKTFEFVGNFQKQYDTGYIILEIYTIYEIVKMFSKLKLKSEYEYKKIRLYPLTRIVCVWKFFYLYLVYKFNLGKIKNLK
jgi:hypothetical protein